jgi:hypothetical protein
MVCLVSLLFVFRPVDNISIIIIAGEMVQILTYGFLKAARTLLHTNAWHKETETDPS